MAKTPKKESVIQPVIRVEGEQHVFEDMEAAGELPILKSVGYARVSPTSREFVSYVITSRGQEVLNVEVSEPNLRAIAEDDAKTAFVSNFMTGDE